MTLCQRGTTQEWTQSPSSTRQRHWVTFTEGRVPSPEGSQRHMVTECPCDAKTEMGYQLHPPSWQMEATQQIGQDHNSRPKPPQSKRKMWTSSAHCHFSPISSSSWKRKSPPQWALMWEMASFHCQHHHHPYHCCLLKIQSPSPAFLG